VPLPSMRFAAWAAAVALTVVVADGGPADVGPTPSSVERQQHQRQGTLPWSASSMPETGAMSGGTSGSSASGRRLIRAHAVLDHGTGAPIRPGLSGNDRSSRTTSIVVDPGGGIGTVGVAAAAADRAPALPPAPARAERQMVSPRAAGEEPANVSSTGLAGTSSNAGGEDASAGSIEAKEPRPTTAVASSVDLAHDSAEQDASADSADTESDEEGEEDSFPEGQSTYDSDASEAELADEDWWAEENYGMDQNDDEEDSSDQVEELDDVDMDPSLLEPGEPMVTEEDSLIEEGIEELEENEDEAFEEDQIEQIAFGKLRVEGEATSYVQCATYKTSCACNGVVLFGRNRHNTWSSLRANGTVMCHEQSFGEVGALGNETCRCYDMSWCSENTPKDGAEWNSDPAHRRRDNAALQGLNMHQRRRWCGWGPRDCLWSEWTPYGACSQTCGAGFKKRRRFQELTQANGGTCVGWSEENQTCNLASCPSSPAEANSTNGTAPR